MQQTNLFLSEIMNDKFDYMEDWDLQAVVRGWNTAPTNTAQASSTFASNNLMDFQGDFNIKAFFNYDPVSLSQPISSPIILNTNSMYVPAEDKHLERHDKLELISSKPVVEKSRRNQHKKVVKQVTAECLSSDMWTWRKYGQKPIKGSPYPRSYYRCSSLKGCLARKQVEKSNTDPNLFIITYTSDHNHAHPVRRGSASRGGRNKSVNLEEVAKQSKSAETEFRDHLIPKIEEIGDKTMELECASDELIMPADMDDLFEDFEGLSPSLEFLINGF